MIQRLQSVLLLLAALGNLSAFFLPYGYASVQDAMDGPKVTMLGGSATVETLNTDLSAGAEFGTWKSETLAVGTDPFLTAHGLLIWLNGFSLAGMIFMFKNRPRQIKLIYVGIVMLMIQITIAAVIIWTQMARWLGAENLPESSLDMGPQFGFFVPLVAVLLCWWAVKRIQKDEKMVRDMDRIR